MISKKYHAFAVLLISLISLFTAEYAQSAEKVTASHLEHICDQLGHGYGQKQSDQYECLGYIAGAFDAYILTRQLKEQTVEYCPENIYLYGPTVKNMWIAATDDEKKLSADQFVMLMLKSTKSKCNSPEKIRYYGERTERLLFRCNGKPSPYERSYCYSYIRATLDYFNTAAENKIGKPRFCVKHYEDVSLADHMLEIYKANPSDPDMQRAVVSLVFTFDKWHSCGNN